jgi:hypothetical protein
LVEIRPLRNLCKLRCRREGKRATVPIDAPGAPVKLHLVLFTSEIEIKRRGPLINLGTRGSCREPNRISQYKEQASRATPVISAHFAAAVDRR